MTERLRRWFETIEQAPFTLKSWVLSFMAIVAIRVALEHFYLNFPFRFADSYFYYFTDFLLSFAVSLLVITMVIRWGGQVSFPQAANLGLLTFLIIWLPPSIDEVISQGEGLWSFYSFDSLANLFQRYLTFFGDNPEVSITYGIRIEVALALLFIFTYTLIKSRRWWRALVDTLVLYSALFVILALPSFVVIALEGPTRGFLQIQENDIATFMLKPEVLFGLPAPSVISVFNLKVTLLFAPLLSLMVLFVGFRYFRPYCLAFLRNARLPQVLYHTGLFLLGGGLVYLYGEPVFVANFFHFSGLIILLIAVSGAWLASVVVNDLHDVAIDRLTNPRRPLVENSLPRDTYITLGLLCFFVSVVFAAIISTQAALLLMSYQALAYLYSATPLRLKRYPVIATMVASAASLCVLIAGYIVFSADKNITTLPWSVLMLLFVAYTLLLPIKDFKDIEGDQADGVTTLPILFGEVWAKRIIGAMLFLLFLVSVFVFDMRHLFWLAFFFGSLAYWLLQMSSKDHRHFDYHHLAHWYIALVSAYVLFISLPFLIR